MIQRKPPRSEEDKYKHVKLNFFSQVQLPTNTISAKSWVAIDLDTGEILQSFNHDQRLQIASLTKIMTCHLAIQMCSQMQVQVHNTFTEVSSYGASMNGTTAYLCKGDILSIQDLFYALMLPSGNDAAITFAENFGVYCKGGKTPIANFVQDMNKTARQLHMKDTHYANPHGLNNRGNYSTAYDVALLCREALKSEQFKKIVSTRLHCCTLQDEEGYNREQMWENTNKMLYQGFKGIKTGFTTEAGPCLASYHRSLRETVIVTLNSRSVEDRWKDTMSILQLTQQISSS